MTLEQHKNNPKQLWKNIRQFWPTGKNSKTKINNIEGHSDPITQTNLSNRHFSQVGSNTAASLDPNIKIDDFLPTQLPPIFDIMITDASTIAKAIDRLSVSPLSGFDGITSYMIKAGKTELLKILLHRFNLSITSRKFPTAWKSAKITPLFKSGNMSSPTNYRPISILPTLGKLLERIIHDQLYHYLSV